MDRQSILGFVLIFIVLVVWMWINNPPPKQGTAPPAKSQVKQDTVKVLDQPPPEKKPDSKPSDPYGKFFAARATGTERFYKVETPTFRAEISSKGGRIKTWELKNYKTWDGKPVQLVDYESNGDLSLLFTTADGRLINTKELYFDILTPGDHVELGGNNFEFEIILSLPASNGGRLLKTLKFRNNVEGFTTDLKFVNLGDVIANYEYQILWEHGVRYAEHNSIDESSFAAAYAYAGKELTEIDATSPEKKVEKDLTGVVDWVATRNKYFAVALIPGQPVSSGAYLEGTHKIMPDNGATEIYSIALKMPFTGNAEENCSFKVFLGPLDLGLLRSYDANVESIMSLGWAWVIRPIAEYIMLPLFNVIHLAIPNWGIVIIVFSMLIKIALHPLTRTQMKSMKKMQALQPLMDEVREKYKDDPQKMNQAIMNLYKEYGVNPAGGCLPLLLQLPILYALYSVFRANIELRQASFVWWITDLSVPDIAVSLPFHIPLFGVKDLSGIALIMGVSMFVQQKMTVKDPRQKMMIWMMPIMMTLIFNSLPSGLNLYYTVFNILAIIQQVFVNKQHDAEPLRKVEPKKKSRGAFFAKFKDMPRLKK